MRSLMQSVCRYLAGTSFRACSIAVALRRPRLLIPLALLTLGTLFVMADGFSAEPSQASVNGLGAPAVEVKAIHAGSGCATPNPEATIAYDDGLFNFGLVASPLSTIAANRFCVDSPANVVSARLYLVGPILRPITVHILDAGFTSTFSLDIDPQFDNWLDVDLTSANISVDGDFYIGLQWLELFDAFPRPYLGVDTTTPHHDQSFFGSNGSRQASPRAGEDFMIRVTVQAPGPPPPPDDDGDGVPDSADLCTNTPSGETVDANGCSPSQLDDDGDGASNANDLCPNTSSGETVDANGCSDNCSLVQAGWSVPPLDDDCDGFTTADEFIIGTDPLLACGPDAWPPDTFEDQLVDSQDMVALLPGLFKSVGQPGYSSRLDIFQPGGVIDSQDLVAFLPFLFKSCEPPP